MGDVSVASPLTSAVLNEAGMTASAAAAKWSREAHTTFAIWPLGLPSVFLCQKVGSLLILMADLVWC